MSRILKVDNLRKGNILNGISFDLNEGEMVAIMGPSGSGKSTLLYNVSGMDQPDVGSILIDEIQMTELDEDEKAQIRLSKVGFVFQKMNVLSNLNLIDNICLPAIHEDRHRKKEIYEKAKGLMNRFEIGDLGDRLAGQVSGGQLQRACICRSLIMDPRIIFADEPTGALNQLAAAEVMDTFLKANSDGSTILMVTHDSKIASKCNRILYLIDGEIKGELNLGKFKPSEVPTREKDVLDWLTGMGW